MIGDQDYILTMWKIVRNASIRTYTLTGVPSVRVKEMFWVGFGDLCSISDQLIKIISTRYKGAKDTIPSTAKRLPKSIVKKYYPYFHQGRFSGIAHTLEEVGDCNKACLPIPKPTLFNDTEQGRRQMDAFRYDEGLDIANNVALTEKYSYNLWSELNGAKHCSPYVTTY